jgi:hypothetical protein
MTVQAPEPAAPSSSKEPSKIKKGNEKEEEELVTISDVMNPCIDF